MSIVKSTLDLVCKVYPFVKIFLEKMNSQINKRKLMVSI